MAAHANRGANGVRLNPTHDSKARAKIQTSQLINRLHQLVNGEVEMAPHQVTAALGLLRKTLPDLSQVSGEIAVARRLEDMSTDELIAIAAGARGSRGAARSEETDGDSEPDSVH